MEKKKRYSDSKRIHEKENTIQEFTVLFWNDKVSIDDTILPLGFTSVDILNLPVEKLNNLIPASEKMMLALSDQLFNENIEKTRPVVSEIQKDINLYVSLLFDLPLFSLLGLDKDKYLNLLPQIYETDKELFDRIIIKNTYEYSVFIDYFKKLFDVTNEILLFNHYVTFFIKLKLENLKQRNSKTFAIALYDFFSDTEFINLLAETSPTPYMNIFTQHSNIMTEFTTMPSPTNKKDFMIAERTVFHHLIDFLKFDLFRGLSSGNSPRVCQNCEKIFLQTDGYHTVYCENIAPDEDSKTCRQIGAKKAEKEKAESSPPIQLYNRLYRKLQQRHRRGTLTNDDWNKKIALALEYKEQALLGEIEIYELENIYKEM